MEDSDAPIVSDSKLLEPIGLTASTFLNKFLLKRFTLMLLLYTD